MRPTFPLFTRAAVVFALSASLVPGIAVAQATTGTMSGSITDTAGGALPNATVIVRGETTGSTRKATVDSQGHFLISGLALGAYTVETTAPGFATSQRTHIQVQSDRAVNLPAIVMAIGNATEQVTVEADSVGSIAAALAPMDALLDATSARTEVTAAFIQNFLSPVADYGEAVEMTPGTFTTNSNGVGLGQS